MTIYNYEELKLHIGHRIVCKHYKGSGPDGLDEVTIECERCNEILYSEFEEEKDGGSAC
jgi:hypothetical protein